MIHKNNGGLNSARREGTFHCTGEWITFLDSDDSLCVDSIKTLIDATSSEHDIVVGYAFQDSNPVRIVDIENWRSELIKSNPILCTAWGKLYRSCLFKDDVYHLKFDERIPAEDMPMNIKIAFNSDKPVKIIPNQVYQYTIRESSLSKSAKWTIKNLEDLYGELLNSIPYSSQNHFIEELIENRIKALKRLILTSNKGTPMQISSSFYIRDLRKDILSSNYHLRFSDRVILWQPDSVIARTYLKGRHLLLIGCQFIKRVLR